MLSLPINVIHIKEFIYLSNKLNGFKFEGDNNPIVIQLPLYSTSKIPRNQQKLYTFKEGDFKRLHLNDIEDMLLLIVQNKLQNLDTNVVVHLVVNLRMFARRIVIQERVEDLQLGVESYQMKLNLTKPRTQDVDMSRRIAYTTLSNPQSVIYEDKLKRKRFMRADELHKFNDGTLISVRDTLYQMLHELYLEYNIAIRSRL
ncbi:hypothetical protein Tco_1470018 [Tanacetum coccineum]